MNFTSQQTRSAYKKLPPDVQDLIMDNETTGLITNTLKEVGLSEEQANLTDSEILYALYCLQSLEEAMNNISQLSGKNVNDLSKLRSIVEDNILSKYKINIGEFIKMNRSEIPEKEIPDKSIIITQDNKEEALKNLDRMVDQQAASIPEIAPNNLPAVEVGETVHDAKPMTEAEKAPVGQNQTWARKPWSAAPQTYKYPNGKDPYHEPLV